MDEIRNILTRGVDDIHVKDHLEAALRGKKKLRVKFGIDPTAPDLHLGHTVVLRKLRQFQNLGHTVVLIIGDFTAQIGDPSGRSETRKPLSEKEIKYNLKNYLAEAGKIVNIKKAEVRYNNEWYATKKGLATLLELTQASTIQQILKREDFKNRLENGSDITVLETLYPLLQGYDSVEVRADVELGGTDQTFNLLMGRRVQRHFELPEQDVMTLPLLEGTDGVRKMSKSYGNYIGLSEKPAEMFGKIMSIPDSLIERYFTLLTDLEMPVARNPRDVKLVLAYEIVQLYHGEEEAHSAREEFINVFSKKELPEEMPELKVGNYTLEIVDLLLKAGVPSKSEARRLVEQGGIKINGATQENPSEVITLKSGDVLKVGKRQFFKIITKG